MAWRRLLPNNFNKGNSIRQQVRGSFQPSQLFNIDSAQFKRDLLTPYPKPEGELDMLVIIPFFNPCNSIRITQNLLLITSKLRLSAIPFVVIHCLFPNSNPVMEVSDSYITVKGTSYAFVKDSLTNIIIKRERQRGKYKKFFALDSDIIFQNVQWYDLTSAALDRVDAVQPFTDYVNVMGDFYTKGSCGQGIFHAHQLLRETMIEEGQEVKGHPGFCMAFTMAFVDKVGFPDLNLLGGGDVITCSLVLNRKLFGGHYQREYYNYVYMKHYKEAANVTWDTVEGTVFHLPANP
jgi:hypothetical protein